MNCENFRSNIFAFLENSISSFAEKEFEDHANQCSECSSLLDEFREAMVIIEQDKRKEVNSFAETRLMQKLANYREAPSWRGFPVTNPILRPLYMSLGIAAAMLLGVMLGFEGSTYPLIKKTNGTDVDKIRLELNVPDIMDDDVVQFSNQ